MIGSGGRDGGTGANPPSTLGSTRKSIVRGSLTEIIHMRERGECRWNESIADGLALMRGWRKGSGYRGETCGFCGSMRPCG